MTNLQQAFELAERLHADQRRKASVVPGAAYLSHLLEVAGMALGACGNHSTEADQAACAALLHDAIEDQGNVAREQIRQTCGQAILTLVLECTEPGTGGAIKASWQARKDGYLEHLAGVSMLALLTSVADKLQSARETRMQVRRQGDAHYLAFVKEAPEADRKALVLWFQRALANTYRARLSQLRSSSNHPILDGIDALIDEFEETVSWLESR